MVVLLLGVIWSCVTTLPMVVEAIPLLNGRYETVTDVQEYLDLALDAADMKESDVLATKLSIYQEVRMLLWFFFGFCSLVFRYERR